MADCAVITTPVVQMCIILILPQKFLFSYVLLFIVPIRCVKCLAEFSHE